MKKIPPQISFFLDLLRGLSAQLVALSHVRTLTLTDWGSLHPNEKSIFLKALYLSSSLGHQAVVIFFVISGYLIGGSVINDCKNNLFDTKKYIANRLSRLYTVLIPAIIIGFSLDLIGFYFFNQSGIYSHAWTQKLPSMDYDVSQRLDAQTAFGNLFFTQTILTECLGSNGPLWSLANEFWYYTLFPFISLAIFCRSRVRKSVFLIISILTATFIYPSILLYGSIWLLGAITPSIKPKEKISPAVSIVIFAIILTITPTASKSSSGAVMAWVVDFILAASLSLVLASNWNRQPEAGGVKWKNTIRVLSGYSYSLYLFHFPISVITCAIIYQKWKLGLSANPSDSINVFVLFFVLVFANIFSYMLYLVTEKKTPAVRDFILKIISRQ